VFCFDGDEAGRKAAWLALEVSLPYLADNKTVRFLFLPPEHDPDSFVREKGKDAFEKKLEAAQPLSEVFLDYLIGRVDIKTYEGRAQIVHEAKPLLKQVSAQNLKLQLIEMVAAQGHMSPQQAIRLTHELNQGRVAEPVSRQDRGMQLTERRLERLLLLSLLAKPALAVGLPSGIVDPGSFEGRMLLAVAEFSRKNPDAPGGALVEHFKGTEFAASLASSQAALLETKLEADHMEVEFHGVVALWQQKQRKSRLDALTAKANPTIAEQVEMRDLLVQMSELKGQSETGSKNARI